MSIADHNLGPPSLEPIYSADIVELQEGSPGCLSQFPLPEIKSWREATKRLASVYQIEPHLKGQDHSLKYKLQNRLHYNIVPHL